MLELTFISLIALAIFNIYMLRKLLDAEKSEGAYNDLVQKELDETIERVKFAIYNINRFQKSTLGADLYTMSFLINRENHVSMSLQANGHQVTARMPREPDIEMIRDQFLTPGCVLLNNSIPRIPC